MKSLLIVFVLISSVAFATTAKKTHTKPKKDACKTLAIQLSGEDYNDYYNAEESTAEIV